MFRVKFSYNGEHYNVTVTDARTPQDAKTFIGKEYPNSTIYQIKKVGGLNRQERKHFQYKSRKEVQDLNLSHAAV